MDWTMWGKRCICCLTASRSISFSDYKVYAQRNVQWVKRLALYLHDGGCFITLNAVYLGGDKGLLADLREAGYRVRPVNRRFSK